MPDYILATSSSADLPRTWIDEHGIPFISYECTVNDEWNDERWEDDCCEERRAVAFACMRSGDRIKTTMIFEDEYYAFLLDLMKKGKDLIFLDMSQKMSVSYENCKKAVARLRAEFPKQRLYFMDTRCVSGGLGTLVYEMVRRKEAGMNYDELIAWGEENKLKIAHRFTVDDLQYLKRSGRVSNASALVGSLLSIKPVLYVSDGGTLDVVKKAHGRKAALGGILDGVLHDLSQVDVQGREIHILHADCLADAEYIRDQVKKAYPQLGRITISSLGVVIGAHCGPGLLAVFYLCAARRPN